MKKKISTFNMNQASFSFELRLFKYLQYKLLKWAKDDFYKQKFPADLTLKISTLAYDMKSIA